jgi:hypothetical protein
MRRAFVIAAALATGLAAAPAAQAASPTCKLENGLLEVHQPREAGLLLSVVQGTIVVTDGFLPSSPTVTCSGGTPTTSNTDTVLYVDDSDIPSTVTPVDGNSKILIRDPAAFAPGRTAEAAGKSEIEFFVDMRNGYDFLEVVASSLPATLVAGNEGMNFNDDDDRDVVGMPFDDVRLVGGSLDDRLSAGGGAGTGAALSTPSYFDLKGNAGDDVVRASDRQGQLEFISGGEGDDVIEGGAGPDVISGGPGDDAMVGGQGVDRVDYSFALSGVTVDLDRTDAQPTGQGRDSVVGFENLVGSRRPDTLLGNEVANEIDGLEGDDTLEGRRGYDILRAGEGEDTVSYARAEGAVEVDIGAGRGYESTGVDVFDSVDNVIGSPFADSLTGNELANRIVGGAGADTVVAGAGADRVQVRDGERDGVVCGAGGDRVTADGRALEVVTPDCEDVDVPSGRGSETPDPTGTPGRRLGLVVTAARTQRLLRQKTVRVFVRCSVACTIAGKAVRPAPAARRVRTALKPGVAKLLRVRLSSGQLSKLRRAVAAGRRPSARIKIEARDAAGNRAARTLGVRMR